jgi:CubicO group peptidase (beta-lactamase class C family)
MVRLGKLPWILAVCTACATAHPPAPQPRVRPEPAPTTEAAARGYRVTLPARWTRIQGRGFETFLDPDRVVRVHLLESSEPDLVRAIALAWKTAAPGMALRQRGRIQGVPPDLFQEQLVVTYMDDSEDHLAQAVALKLARDERKVYIFLLEGPTKALEKRAAELTRIVTSLEVDGGKTLALKPQDRQPFDAATREVFFGFVDEMRVLANVPAVAVAVVTPEGVFTQGFGARATTKDAALVDADTQFMIGSITKSFSTLLLATLVDGGAAKWETPASEAFPSFRVADPARTRSITLQHLFCACVGAPRHDMELLFEYAEVKPADVFNQIAAFELTTAFGETFQYNNQLTAAGGFIAGRLTFPKERDLGRAYGRALRERVLDKAGMKDTTLDANAVKRRGNFAMPHTLDWSGESRELDPALERFVEPIAPAGGLWSTANDMAKYLELQLGHGSRNGAGVVSAENLARTQTTQIQAGKNLGYGMGWLVGSYKGLKVIEHSGGTLGFNADVAFFPDIGVGLFLVANRSPAAIAEALRLRLFELLFRLSPRAKTDAKHRLGEMRRLFAEQRAKVSSATVPDELLGRYTSDRLGPIVLARRDRDVELDAGEWRARVALLDAKERPRTLIVASGPLQGLTLAWRGDDAKRELVLKHSQTDYVFTRR